MARLFADFAYGNLTVAVDQSATTLSSARFTRLPQVTAPDFLPVVLDPDEAEGALPETVWVTDHAAGSSSAVVARGQEGTAARAHAADCTWRATVTTADFALEGDLSGDPRHAQVTAIQGVAVTGTPATGNVLAATGTSAAHWAAPTAVSSVAMGGDVTGNSATATVAKVNGVAVSGAPTTGQVLTATGASTADWETPVTGGVLAGDVSGAAGSNSVDKIHGVDVTAAGTPSNGYRLVATDATHATWQAGAGTVTMAGDVTSASNTASVDKVHGIDVTGAGTPTTGQVLTATDGTHATWQAAAGGAPSGSAGGDLTGTYPNPTITTSGATAGTYGDGTHVPAVSINAKGIVTGVSNVAITGSPGSGLPQSGAPHVVAPNSASAAVKLFANFVGTGVSTTGGDEVAINNAITAAASANGVGKVVLLPGTYWVNASSNVNGNHTAIVMQQGVTLEGSEPAGFKSDGTVPVAVLSAVTGAYVKLCTTPTTVSSIISHTGYASSSPDHNMTVRNIIFDGDCDNHKSGTQRQMYDCGDFWATENLLVENCWFMNARGNHGSTSSGSTTANGSGSSSTTLVLTSASGFSVGSEISIGGVTNLRKINALSGNTATLDQAATWANGATVTWQLSEKWNFRNQRGKNTTVRDCVITRTSTTDGSTGINSLFCDGVFYENIWSISNAWHGINHHGSSNVRCIGCHSYLNLHWGLIEGCRDITWESCYFGGESVYDNVSWGWPANTSLGNTATATDSGNNDGSENCRFIGCHWINNAAPMDCNDNTSYDASLKQSTHFIGCHWKNNGNSGDKAQLTFTGSTPANMVHNTKLSGGCTFTNTLGATFNDIALPTGAIKFANSPNGATGGVVPSPAKPASGATIVNPYPFACQVAVTGGTGTNTTVVQNGVTTTLGAGNATAFIEPGDSIGLGAYTGSPQWTWFAVI